MALDRILFGDEGQPTGPQAAWMQGLEDTYYKSMRDFQLQQAAEKQASDIEEARQRNISYRAQTEAQLEGVRTQQEYRRAQQQALMDKQDQERQRIANANLAVLSDLYRTNPQEAERVLPQMRGSFSPEQQAILGSKFSPDLIHALARASEYTKGVQELRKTEGVEQNKNQRQSAELDMRWKIANLNNSLKRELKDLDAQLKLAKPESYDQLLAKNQRVLEAAARAAADPNLTVQERAEAEATLQAAKEMQLRAIQTKQSLMQERQQLSLDPATNKLAVMPTTVPQTPGWAKPTLTDEQRAAKLKEIMGK